MSRIVDLFSDVARDDPRRPLIFIPESSRTLSAAALWELSLAHAEQLYRAGHGAGDLIVAAMGNRPAFLSLVLAARRLDLALMAADPGATSAEIAELGKRFGAAAVVLPALAAGDSVTDGLDVVPCLAERRRYHGAAALKVTSGSTGVPKATFTTESQLIDDSQQIMRTMGIGPADTQLAAIPLSHAYGFSVIAIPLLLGGTPIILREAFVPQQLAADVHEFGGRRFPGVPFMFEHLIHHPPADSWPHGFDRLISAGAPLTPELSRRFHGQFRVKIHTFYGTTESGGISYDESEDPATIGTVGRPLSGVEVTLVAEPDLPGGRVHVRGAGVSQGYVGPDRGDFTDTGFLTGDYGTIGDDGRLTLVGRVSSFINVAGRKVQPAEVETVLRMHEAIADVRVIGGHDEKRGEHVVACVVARAGGERPTTLAIRRFCADRLAPHKIPRSIVFVDKIPLTVRGKTDRDALQALVRTPH